jgi:hypothetical protein
MLMAIAAGTAEPIGPARFLQGCLTLLLGAVEPLKLRQRERPFWNWMALRAMTVLVYVYQFIARKQRLRSERGNQEAASGKWRH